MLPGLRGYRAPILLGLTFVLLALTLFLSSPLHRHDLLNGKACPYTAFEHGGMERVADAAPLIAPGLSGSAPVAPDPLWQSMPGRSAAASRAPPSHLSLSIA